MKVSLIAALTLDGFIARHSSEFASWTSKEDKRRFVSKTKTAGVIILGSKTFDTFPKPLPDRLHIIHTRDVSEYTKKILGKFSWDTLPENILITSKEPEDVLEDLEKRGFSEVFICGGSQIYSLYLNANLINYLYLTIEPVLFGSGISLFNSECDFKLRLISEERTELGTLLLEHEILQNS
ncbi:MAG: dihydrofolate reductase [Candidatus Taylorbacteria bacterium]|nr:dihydrofolate reductase [Candidatus Taylorbacteria bacterium]